MSPTSNRRKPSVTAFVVLILWLLAVIAVVLWRRPEFWIDANQRFQRAEALASEGRVREAIEAVDLALAKQPDNVGYLVFKGYRQLDIGENAGAQQSFGRAMSIDPSHTEARLGSASTLAQLRKRDEALTTLQPLSPETTSSAQLHRRSQLYSRLDAPQSALGDLSALLHADPGNAVFLKDAAALALQLKDWDRAASLLQQLDFATADPTVKKWAAANRTIASRQEAGLAAAHRSTLPLVRSGQVAQHPRGQASSRPSLLRRQSVGTLTEPRRVPPMVLLTIVG